MKQFSLIALGLIAASSLALGEDEIKVAAQARKGAPAQHRNVAPGVQAQHRNVSPAMQAQRQQALNSSTVRQLTNSRHYQPSRSTQYSSAGVPSRVYQANGDPRTRNWQNNGNWNRGANGNVSNAANVNAAAAAQANVTNNEANRRRYSSGNGGQWSGRNWSHYNNWDRGRHDRSWYRSRYNRFATFGGGYYYWDNGFWFPAYGYDPYFSSYVYDAPIYSYNDQDPGQVIANVQSALQQQGFYEGAIDGTYGPMTRRALLNFQRQNGLPESGQIDQDTLGALGMQ